MPGDAARVGDASESRVDYVGAVIMLMLLAVPFVPWVWAHRSTAFDSDTWKECRDFTGGHAPRWRMREDVQKVIRPGMTRGNVEALLGRGECGGIREFWTLRRDMPGRMRGSSGSYSEGSRDRRMYLWVYFDVEDRVQRCEVDY